MTKVSENVKMLRAMIRKAASNADIVEFLEGFPSVYGMECVHQLQPYSEESASAGVHQSHKTVPLRQSQLQLSTLEYLVHQSKQWIETAMSLTMPRATVFVTFVLGDLDPQSSGGTPHVVPIGYALKGSFEREYRMPYNLVQQGVCGVLHLTRCWCM